MIPTKNLALLSCCVFLLCLGATAQADDDYGYYSDNSLQAPNVSFFAAAQASSTNLHYLGGDREGGFNLLVGAYFNDVNFGGLRYGVELGYLSMGESQSSTSRKIQSSDSPPSGLDLDASRLQMLYKTRLSGLSFGGRFEGERFFFRFGGMLYHYNNSSQRILYYVYDSSCTGCDSVNRNPSYSESKSSLAPYVGFGLHIPLIEHLRLTAGYDVYNVESHRVDSVTIGLMYTD